MKSALNLFGLKKADTEDRSAAGLDDFLSELPERLGFNVSFRKSLRTEGGLNVEVEGEEVDSLIGNSSEVLDALSHLAMRVQRKREGVSNEPITDESKETHRIVFDAAGFRDRKAEELREMASQKRQRVLDSGGKPSYIPALSPSDRKIIHTHLVELGDVVSESIGKGNFKRIRVRLKDDSRRTPESRENTGDRRPRSQVSTQGQQRPQRADGVESGNGQSRDGGARRRQFSSQRTEQEINGNRAVPEPAIEEIDDNVGNRLAPGEQPMFNYANPRGSDGND